MLTASASCYRVDTRSVKPPRGAHPMFVAAARTTRKVASHSAVARWTMRGALGFNPIVSSAFSNVARVRQMGAMPHAHRWGA